MRPRLHFVIAGTFLSILNTAICQPTPAYAALYVFGSSWADTQYGPYWNGHWSNGPMWPDYLAFRLLGRRPANNYAVGGSYVDAVLNTVISFRAPTNAALCLFHLWAGYTDFYDTDNLTNDAIWNARIQSRVSTLSNAVVQLYAKGARSIVVPNVFDRSHDPEFVTAWQNDNSSRIAYSARIDGFNSAWAAALKAIDNATPDLRLFTLDFHSRFDNLVTHFSDYSFTKAYPDALDDPSLSNLSFDGPGDNYLYWDPHHATSKAHLLFSSWNYEVISNSILEKLEFSVTSNSLNLQMQKLRIGRTYRLQSSTNLLSWSEAQTFTATAGTNLWSIHLIGSVPTYYRLRWQQ